MADENNTEIVETAPVIETTPPKKRRGPQAKKVALEAPAETTVADGVKTARGSKKRPEKPANDKGVTANKAKPAKSVSKTSVTKQATSTPPPVLDGITDLLQLEEENARLRKALAEKLRAENADLRKRLGLA